jgi:peptide/nickel transport system ATP-binding protein
MSDLRIERLEIRDRQGRILLAALDLDLMAGRCLCLIGESGAGKSLVCAAVAGTLSSELSMSGRIWLRGREITRLSAAERQSLWGRDLFLLPQEPWTALAAARTARAQIGDMPRLHGGGAASGTVATLLERVGLVPLTDGPKRPSQLSGGMAQRVAIATTLGAPARLILVDEPTKGLDADRRALARDGMRSLLSEGRSVLLVTHDLELARQLGDETVVMRDGQVLERGPTSEVLTRPRHDFTRALLAAEPSGWAKRPSSASDVLVRATDLSIAAVRGGPVLVRDLSFSIAAGGITGLSGASGRGKTTLGDTVIGLRRRAAGTVTWERKAVVQKLYQDPGAAFAPWRMIGATMADALAGSGIPRGRLADLCKPILVRLGLNEEMLDRRPGAVSGGELQRLSLARALLCRADLIFADEPTSRLDAVSQQRFIELLCKTAAAGTAILLASHDNELLAKSADRMIVL